MSTLSHRREATPTGFCEAAPRASTEKNWVIAYIGLGANLGDSRATCRLAIERLRATPGIRALCASSFYESEPHVRDSRDMSASADTSPCAIPWYVNAVVEIETELSSDALLTFLRSIEVELGRDVSQKGQWLPRPIDLDLLAYADEIRHTPECTVPHPRLHERRFVLAPWAELAPEWRHPILKQTIRDLLHGVNDDKALAKV